MFLQCSLRSCKLNILYQFMWKLDSKFDCLTRTGSFPVILWVPFLPSFLRLFFCSRALQPLSQIKVLLTAIVSDSCGVSSWEETGVVWVVSCLFDSCSSASYVFIPSLPACSNSPRMFYMCLVAPLGCVIISSRKFSMGCKAGREVVKGFLTEISNR